MNNDPSFPPQTGFRTWLVLVRILCWVAFGLSSYLLWGALTGEQLPGCGMESGCAAVLSSRWAYLLGVPVSLPALVLYASVFAATMAMPRARTPARRQQVRRFMIAAAAALLAAAIWFVGLQVLVIRSICPFCLSAHACGFLVGTIILFKTLSVAGAANRESSPGLVPGRQALWVLAGLIPVFLLVAGQVVFRPRTFAVTSAPDLAARKAPRILQLHGGALELNLNNVPLYGSPGASNVVVHLFDYSCEHCRALHPILVQAWRRLSNQVVVASLPVPLATNCNWVLKRPIPAHINACAYAYCGLAVWRANPGKLEAFDDWFFTPPLPPAPDKAEAEAMRLVGTNQFKTALADPWIHQQVDFNIRLYTTNYYRCRKQVLPELMVGTNIISGEVPDVETLFKLLSIPLNFLPEKGLTNEPGRG